MEIRRCMRCMHELKPGQSVCPECGQVFGRAKSEAFALKPGTILNGTYLVGEMLGQGGFGITYIGFDLLLEQKVAIKEYFPMSTGMVSRENRSTVVWSSSMMEKSGAERGFDSFLKEARKMARLRNIPNVVGVNSVFIQNDTAYIVMDFIEGETLQKKLLRDGPMTFDTCVSLLTPIMQALAKVHQHGIIHRDISPDNIMVQTDGTLTLLDLGAAKDLDIQRADGTTQSSQLVAKQGFSPFEQYIRNGKTGPWTDIYAMAATVYYCCTGKLPPSAIERMERDTLSCQPLLTKAQFNALAACMTVLPEKRPQDMNAMLRIIGHTAEKAETTQPEPPKPTPLKTEPSKPEPPEANPPKTEPKKPESRQTKPPKRKPALLKWLLPIAAAGLVVLAIAIDSNKQPSMGLNTEPSEEITEPWETDWPTAPSTRPTAPSSEPTTPSSEPTTPSTAPTYPKPTYPTGETTEGSTEPRETDWPTVPTEPTKPTNPKYNPFAPTTAPTTEPGEDVPPLPGEPWWDTPPTTPDTPTTAPTTPSSEPTTPSSAPTYPKPTYPTGETTEETTEPWETETMPSTWPTTRPTVPATQPAETIPAKVHVMAAAENLSEIITYDARADQYFWGQTTYKRSEVKTVTFQSTLSGAPWNAWDVSEAGDRSILAWMDGGNLYVAANGKIAPNSNASWMFASFENLKKVDFGDCFDTAKVTDMGWMFNECSSLTELDVSGFKTANVTNMRKMFANCSSLTSLDLSDLDTSNVTNMRSMFEGCSSLIELDLSGLDTSNVTNMRSMFEGCSSLIELDLSGFDTTNVTNMMSMFWGCRSLTSLDLSSFDTANVTDMWSMFFRCSGLTSLDLSGFDTAKVTDMGFMFNACSSLKSLDLSGFNTANVTSMIFMFSDCRNLADFRCPDWKIHAEYDKRFR